MQTIQRFICATALLIFLFILTGCGKQDTVTKPNPRPVAVIKLREINPVKALQLTGSVKSWKDENISFEVDGQVEWIVEMGTNLEGHWEEDKVVHVQGDTLARLDKRIYEIKLKRAKAEVERAQAEYDRKKQAWGTKAISEVDYIRSVADRDASEAEFEHSDYKLDRCTLYAPFSGEVSEVFVEAGGYVYRGDPVAHLVMMDPIKIDVSVSPATFERLHREDTVRIFLPGVEEPAFGSVYEKATVADSETRTFRVSIMTRNRKTVGRIPSNSPLLDYPQITEYTYLQSMRFGEEGSPFIVEENRQLHKEGDEYYVWASPELKLGDKPDPEKPLITLRKYTVTPSEDRTNLQGIYLARGLSDIGELAPGSLIAMDVPDGFKDGDKVIFVDKQWQLRPGQLIPVYLDVFIPEPGLYLPMNSINPVNQEIGEIFVAVDGKAKKVKVKILSNVGELFRLEALNPEESSLVAPGARVITDHIHFLVHDEPVRIIRTRELNP